MIHPIITGAAGRMGKRLIALIKESSIFQLAGAIEANGHPALGKDAGESAECGFIGIPIQDSLDTMIPKGNVIIDFTTPAATLTHLRHALQQKCAMVVGTTGFSEQELDTFRDLAQSVPCVFSPNMSVGINVMLNLLGEMARTLGNQYDIEVVEAHHNKKMDAPSGTALKIAEVLANGMGWNLSEVGVYARHGMIGARRGQEIGIQTIRAGDIVGDHTVLFGGPGERIELTHRAHTRDTFAYGALRAAEWVITQPPGLYSMAHVLGLARS